MPEVSLSHHEAQHQRLGRKDADERGN